MTKKQWVGLLLAVVAVFVALAFVNQSQKIDLSNVNRDQILAASDNSGQIADRVLGNPAAKLVLIEYADFQCPGCAGANESIRKLIEKHPDQVALVFRHYPLNGHTSAFAAAAVAEAAGQQGKFWEMVDLLYQNQVTWSSNVDKRDQTFKNYAENLGLDLEKFDQDRASSQVSQKIKFNSKLAQSIPISETPSFFLNGEKIEQDIWSSESELEKFIQTKLN